MTWTLAIIPLAALIGIILGVRAIQGKGLTHSRGADLKRMAAWKKAEAMGPIVHGLRLTASLILYFCILAPSIRYWLETGRLGVRTGDVGLSLVAAIFLGAGASFFSWKVLQAEAREAAERLSRDQPEPS